jgi:hypothetical protein
MRRIALLTVALLAATPAVAGEHVVPTVTDPLTKKECGSCHMAFQPAFLPARSWTRMMAELPKHFGEDASLPADKAAAIQAYLETNAGDRINNRTAGKFLGWVKPDGTPQRITENPYFIKEHRKISDAEWKKPEVLTKSNCAACHKGAEQGWYEDD